ncbi:hypothetical protein L0128_06770 [candidate division KSB1 bacterium]|nr:hypothetical protein [candidate division KSB1 bacterium]
MADRVKYYEIYGELIKSKIFLQRLVIGLLAVIVLLAVICYIAFTRPAQTFVIKDGYAYAAYAYSEVRSVPEVRRFCQEFAKNLLEFNRDDFNDHIKTALQMCSQELEYVMYKTIKESEIPRIVQNSNGTIKFEISEILVKEGDPFGARVAGKQIFPGQAPIDVTFDLEITVVTRTEDNPFGLKIINFKQS